MVRSLRVSKSNLGFQLLVMAVVVVGLIAPARADDADNASGGVFSQLEVEGGVWLGMFLAASDHELYQRELAEQEPIRRVSANLGARAGLFYRDYVGVEFEGGFVPSQTRETERPFALYTGSGQVVGRYPALVTPFVLAGGTMLFSRSESLGNDEDFSLHVGVGAKYHLTKNLHIRADARLYFTAAEQNSITDDGGGTQHGAITIGLAWAHPLGSGNKVAPSAAELPADTDGDGISDAEDNCPKEVGVAPDGCPQDLDGDGIIGAADACPDEAETMNGHQDEDGCPDALPDADGDGIVGSDDKCPNQAEDKDSFEDDDGCPDTDNDGDQLLDSADRCPSVAGPVENGGCPDTDGDRDGIVDRLDNCPKEPGDAAFQGCKKKQLARITNSQIEILDRVYFRTGSNAILKRSHPLLNNVAAVIVSHPDIKRVEIGGHTDDRGDMEKNQALSKSRAEEVARYLVSQGVSYTRLFPVGFGQDKPIADNKTKAGREQNRRVEFKISPTTTVETP